MQAAIVRKVSRIENEVGSGESRRVDWALDHREVSCTARGIYAIDAITIKHLDTYRRQRIKKAALKMVWMETLYIEQATRSEMPRPIHGRFTPNREFTAQEQKDFFAALSLPTPKPDRKPKYVADFSSWRTFFLTMQATGARAAEFLHSPYSRHVPLLPSEVAPDTCAIVIRSAKQRSDCKSR